VDQDLEELEAVGVEEVVVAAGEVVVVQAVLALGPGEEEES